MGEKATKQTKQTHKQTNNKQYKNKQTYTKQA
jgi:hypothetical protein